MRVAESALKRLLVQSSHYSVASLLTMVAGLVTFPLLTRIFSVADYGVMNLVAATLSLSVALGKVGIQHSIVRYQSEIAAGKGQFTLRQLYSTTVFGMMGTALVIMLLVAVGAQLVPARWLGPPQVRGLFAIASLLIVVQVVESAFINFLRAEQGSALLMKYQVARKYLGLAVILVAVLGISRSLTAFYSATVITEAMAVLGLAWLLFGRSPSVRPRPSLAHISRPLYRQLLAFGIPMMVGYELSGIILAVGDRYVIEGLLGETQLGLYGAAYNLCQYVQAAVVVSVGQAIMPIYMQMWDREGVKATSAFITSSLRTYVLLGAPLIAGLAAVGPELLPGLASEKYATAAVVLPWVIAGMVMDGSAPMLGAGLFIHRKTRMIMAIVLGSAVVNITLNLVLVARIGIVGSAISTLVSYSLNSVALTITGRRLVPVAIPWGTLLRAVVGAVVMYGAVKYLLPGRRLLTVGVRMVVGAPLYALIIVLIDPDARRLGGQLLGRFRGSGAKEKG
jgi:O-antigen/teichoic acid export membrane protein